jgi:hypothetical protein
LELNEFLQKFALQNHESGSTKTYVAEVTETPAASWRITACAPGRSTSPTFPRSPAGVLESIRFRFTDSLDWPSIKAHSNRGLEARCSCSARRAMSAAASAGGVALAIDAKDEAAAAWYQDKFAALPLLDSPLRLILTFSTIAAALAAVFPDPGATAAAVPASTL